MANLIAEIKEGIKTWYKERPGLSWTITVVLGLLALTKQGRYLIIILLLFYGLIMFNKKGEIAKLWH